MESTLEKLSARELFQLKWLLGQCMALVSLWTVFYLAMEGAWLIGAIMVAIAGATVFPRLPGLIPALVWKLAPFALIVFILADFVLSGSDFIPPLIRMIALLLAVRALEYRTRRQDLQLVLLALFVVIITGVLTMELSFAFQILLFTPIAMLVLFLVNLSESSGPAEQEIAPNPWAGFRWPSFAGRLRRSIDRRLILFVAALFAGTTATAVLFFVALPRFELGQALPFLRMQSQQSLSGFSETVEFGEVVDIIADDAVAFRADVTGGRPDSIPYWRVLALDEYHGNGFRVSESSRNSNRQFSDYRLQMAGMPASDDAGNWTIYLESGITRFLPSPGRFAEVRFQSRQDLSFNRWLHVLGLREVPGNVLFYQMGGVVQTDRLPALASDRPLLDAQPMPLTDVDGEVRSLDYPESTIGVPADAASQAIFDRILAEITQNEGLAAETFAERATRWLQTRHPYSVQTSIPEGPGDLLARWMESDEPGHCELFAGAFLLLAREAGYPARLITGFRGGDWNGYENYFMVRNSDAHAWVELFAGERGWLRVDPTPGPSSEAQVAQALPGFDGRGPVDRTFGAYLDSLRILWYRRVVNFDQRQQQEMVAGARDWLTERWQKLREAAASRWLAVRDLFIDGWRPGMVAVLFENVLVPLALVVGGILLWRYRACWGRRSTSIHRVRRRAGRCLRQLENAHRDQQAMEAELYDRLLTLRYDRPENWPASDPVFRRAARLRRRQSRSKTKL